MTSIQRIELPITGIEQLRAEALGEGYNFIGRLVAEWSSRENRFDGPGEILCGYMEQGVLVASGGLNRDPFAEQEKVGRVRRVYVRPGWRNHGLGEVLVRSLITHAQGSFSCLRLRTDNSAAARLYERVGFSRTSGADATHVMRLD